MKLSGYTQDNKMRAFVFILITSLAAPLGIPSKVKAQSSTIRLPEKRMDVREALRLLRVATEQMELGNYDRACSIYDRLLTQFKTWWIPLAGRIRCGLKRSEEISKLAEWVDKLVEYEAPSHVVQRLTATVTYEQERLQLKRNEARRKAEEEAEKARRANSKLQQSPPPQPKPTPAEPIPLPNPDRFIKAWERGNYRVVLEEAARFEAHQELSSGILRITVEAAFLVRSTTAIDYYMPKLLIRTRNMPLLVRYLRNLQNRKENDAYDQWHEVWQRWKRGED